MNTEKTGSYIFFISIVILFAILITTGFHYSIIQENDGARINLAGRQRMLSQRISKEILLYKTGEIPPSNIIKSMNIFSATQDALISGGPAPLDLEFNAARLLPGITNKKCFTKLVEVKNEWYSIKEKINVFITKKDTASYKYIVSHNEILLKKIDDAVYALQLISEKNNIIIRIIISCSFIMISALLLISLVKRIKELKIAEERISELETLLPICSNCKKIRTDNDKPMESDSWTTIEDYLHSKKDMLFTHSICPECIKKFYPGMIDGMKK